jgi:DNA adenine methylase
MSSKAPFGYFGGKQKLLKHILYWFPPHRTYVEVFGGAASVLLNKGPSEVEVYNDINSNLVAFFRVLRDEEKCMELVRLMEATPYSREEYKRFKSEWISPYASDVEKAHRWYFVTLACFSGDRFGGMNMSKSADRAGGYANQLQYLHCFQKRLLPVAIEQLDFSECITRYDSRYTLFYLDPPYTHKTRSGTRYSSDAMLHDAHAHLVDLMLSGDGMFILSCYWDRVYLPLIEAGYYRVNINVVAHSARKTTAAGIKRDGSRSAGFAKSHQARVEVLLISPNCFVRRMRRVMIDG